MSAKEYTPGSLVSYRGRDWIVMPGANADLVNLRPLGGSEVEATAVYLPLDLPGEAITGSQFPPPTEKDLGDFATARMLFHASRLSFRQASGPFRCMGRLSFRPRNYQIVPLVMALEQRTTRLMIADDVGIGKTVEGLLVLSPGDILFPFERYVTEPLRIHFEKGSARRIEGGREAVMLETLLESRGDDFQIDDDFLFTHCPNVVNAINAICNWVQE